MSAKATSKKGAIASKSPSYDALAVANWFVRHAEDKGHVLDIMKLLKLLYFAHGYGARRGRDLIRDDFEAWAYGPVNPAVYDEFRKQGILARQVVRGEALDKEVDRLKKSQGDADLLRDVYEKYGRRDSFSLSRETHGYGSPWQTAVRQNGRRSVIDNKDIVDYFQKLEELA